jgi:SAM-dependent methyltransferase
VVEAMMQSRTRSIFLFLVLAAPLAALAQEKDLDTPYVPTPQVVVSRMLELAQIKPGDTVIDLGSGDGRLVIAAAQKYGARGFGVELDPRLVQRSNEAAARAGVADRVKFLQQDLFQTDFHQANVLTLYLLPDVNMALRPKILEELKPGTRIVSHDYGMREWLPDAQEIIPAPDKTVGARKESMVYLWVVPAKVEGDWDLEVASDGVRRHVPLTVGQKFQVVSATVYVLGHGRVPVIDARLRGDELSLMLPAGVAGPEQVQLLGRVLGDSLTGRVKEGEREIGTWSARRQP